MNDWARASEHPQQPASGIEEMHRDDADRAGAAEGSGGHGWAGERHRRHALAPPALCDPSIRCQDLVAGGELHFGVRPSGESMQLLHRYAVDGEQGAGSGNQVDSFRAVTESQNWSTEEKLRLVALQSISALKNIFGRTGPWCPAL